MFPEDGSGPKFRKDEVFKAVGKVKCMMGQGELATMEFACIGENTPCGSLVLLLCCFVLRFTANLDNLTNLTYYLALNLLVHCMHALC